MSLFVTSNMIGLSEDMKRFTLVWKVNNLSVFMKGILVKSQINVQLSVPCISDFTSIPFMNTDRLLTCEVTNQCPIVGTMHFWKSYDSWHYVSKQGYEELKQQGQIPDI